MTTRTNAHSHQPRPLFAGLGSRLEAVLAAIADASQVARCAREVEHLSRLSDAELARRGLTRDRDVPGRQALRRAGVPVERVLRAGQQSVSGEDDKTPERPSCCSGAFSVWRAGRDSNPKPSDP